jgi:starch-binding outer membrane protein, SusD/RagB family
MTNHSSSSRTRRIARAGVATAVAMLGSGALTACSTLLEADAPSRILESTLLVPSNAPVIVAGAVADFECALGNFILTGGTLADEFADSQANAATWDIDRRTNVPATGLYSTGACNGFGVYTPISTARFQADQAVRLLESWSDADVPGRQALIGRAAAYAGYSYILMGEMFCSAAYDLGPEQTPAQSFALAEARFTMAIDNPATPADVKSMALVGRARARINMGKRTEAAADAAQVADGFVFNARTTAAAGRAVEPPGPLQQHERDHHRRPGVPWSHRGRRPRSARQRDRCGAWRIAPDRAALGAAEVPGAHGLHPHRHVA